MESGMQWYFAKNGVQMGPIGIEELKAKLASGEVSGSDMVWRDGMPDWRKAAEVPELAMVPVSSPQQVVPQPTPEASNSPYAAPTAAPGSYTPPPPEAGKATTAMVLGIISVVTGFFCCLSGLPCGILAIVFASQFNKAAALNPALVTELGKAKTGMITGWIGIALSLLGAILGIVFRIWIESNMSQKY